MDDKYNAIVDGWPRDIFNSIGTVRDVSIDLNGVSVTCEIANQSPSLSWMKFGDAFVSELGKYLEDIDEMHLWKPTGFIFNYPKIKRVIFSGPATIVLFTDGTKSVVKCSENDIYDPEKAVMIAYLKKLFGFSKSQMRKWLNKQTEGVQKPDDILKEET